MIKSKQKGQGKQQRLIEKSLAFWLLSERYIYYKVGLEFCG